MDRETGEAACREVESLRRPLLLELVWLMGREDLKEVELGQRGEKERRDKKKLVILRQLF
jgi:hypothetical protein